MISQDRIVEQILIRITVNQSLLWLYSELFCLVVLLHNHSKNSVQLKVSNRCVLILHFMKWNVKKVHACTMCV